MSRRTNGLGAMAIAALVGGTIYFTTAPEEGDIVMINGQKAVVEALWDVDGDGTFDCIDVEVSGETMRHPVEVVDKLPDSYPTDQLSGLDWILVEDSESWDPKKPCATR